MFPLEACHIAECDVQMIAGMISHTYDDVIMRCRCTQTRLSSIDCQHLSPAQGICDGMPHRHETVFYRFCL